MHSKLEVQLTTPWANCTFFTPALLGTKQIDAMKGFNFAWHQAKCCNEGYQTVCWVLLSPPSEVRKSAL